MLSEWRRPAHFRRLGRDGMHAFWRTDVGQMGAWQWAHGGGRSRQPGFTIGGINDILRLGRRPQASKFFTTKEKGGSGGHGEGKHGASRGM
jgi:hypothetical protein